MCKMRSVERFKKEILSQHKYETCSVQKWKKTKNVVDDDDDGGGWAAKNRRDSLSCNFSPLNFMQYLPSLECHAKLLFHSISRITYTNSSTPSHSLSPSIWKLQLLGNFGSVLAILLAQHGVSSRLNLRLDPPRKKLLLQQLQTMEKIN